MKRNLLHCKPFPRQLHVEKKVHVYKTTTAAYIYVRTLRNSYMQTYHLKFSKRSYIYAIQDMKALNLKCVLQLCYAYIHGLQYLVKDLV